jgi:FkbM family methyltransferase
MYNFQFDLRELADTVEPFLHDGFFFVNIGANDGVVADPIYPFIKKHGWSGIAVEPVPHVFEQLERNYAHLDGVILENVAIADRQQTFWYVAPGSGSVEYITQGIGSFERERVVESIQANRFMGDLMSPRAPYPHELPAPVVYCDGHDGPQMTDDVETFITALEPTCLTFDQLMAKHEVEHVDFVNIDVEGLDHEVLLSIDLERYRPSIICVELMGLPDAGVQQVRDRLDEHGYRFAKSFSICSEVFVRSRPTEETETR